MNKLLSQLLLLLLCLITLPSPTAVSASVITFTEPIANISAPLDQISYHDLKLIFTLSVTKWSNGTRIIVMMYPNDHSTQKAFLKEYLGMNPYRFEEMLESKINTGRISPPVVVETERDMIKQVQLKPGSIGFIKSYIVYGDGDGIKRIKVQ